MRIPVVTQEPVHITGDVPNVTYEQKRISPVVPYNTATYVGPPNGYYWFVDCVQIELQTDANVGTRHVYLYAADKNGNLMRQQVLEGVAGLQYYWIGTPSCAVGTRAIGGTQRVFSSSCYFQVMQFPCRLGVLWDNFQGAADILNVHLLVREYKVA